MNRLNFLSSGGEMGRLIREKDWSKTTLGDPRNWPQSLKTTLSIILNSKFAKFVFWGDDFTCFYNDAYRPSLGNDGKHPYILGAKGEDAWPEIWDIIKPMMDQVIATGIATWSENQLLPFYRNGKMEDIYWTFSYSPIINEDGKIAGIFTTVVETTDDVKSRAILEKANKRYYDNIMKAPVAMSVFIGENFIVEIANRLMLELWGKEEIDILNKPIFEGLPEAKGQGLEQIIEEVYRSGNKFEANERLVTLPRDGKLEEFYLNFVYEPVKDDNGEVNSIVAIASDVTHQVTSRKLIEENEKKLNIFIKASELGTWDLNLETMEVTYSGRYLEIFGYNSKKDSISHQNFLKLLHPDDLAVRNDAFKKAMLTGILNYQARIFWEKDNSMHWYEAKGDVFYKKNGEPIKMTGILRDITNEKKSEQELKDREEKFRLLANEMPQFVWISDAEGYLNYFNQSVYNYTGLNESIIKDNKWLEIVHPDDREENISAWMTSINTGENFVFEHRFKRSDGEHRWQLSRAKALRDSKGNITMWVGTSTDIHDIKELDEQKDYFISMASHELKTPITSIKGYIQLLESKYRNTEDPFLKNSLKVVHKQIESLTTLVADLLDVSKIKTGGLQLKKSSFSVNNLVDEVISEIQHMNPQNEISFTADHVIDVIADEENIRQVLINFLTNAVKYSPDNKQVAVSLTLEKNNLKVSVSDAGIGISTDNQAKIFDRFFRVEGKNEKTFPGFGIGLYIAAEIIRKHQGKIGVYSEMGKGSTFYFTLPIQ